MSTTTKPATSKLSRNLQITITLLSDLHIGTGTGLLKGLDWHLYRDGYVYLADNNYMTEIILDRALADGKREETVINTITGLTLNDLVDAGWLTATDFQAPSKMFRYRLRGQPATVEIREQIKSVNDELFLPGSSLKGALRTILAGVAAKELKPDVTPRALRDNRFWAAQPVEDQLFGRDPNHDFLRLLQVSDSAAVGHQHLRLRQAHIYPTAANTSRGRSKGLDIDLETVAAGTQFVASIHIPLELLLPGNGGFEERRHQELQDWARRQPWLERLAFHGRAYARELLIDEVNYFEKRSDVPAVHHFYSRLADQFSELAKNQFMVPLGWGGGWHTKTLNHYLTEDPKNFEQIASRYRLDPTGDRKVGDPFPKSRHLLRQPNGQPGEPLGWCLVEMISSDQ